MKVAWYDGLTERQRKFCEAYAANGGNGTDAAIDAGYKRPDVEASRTLRIAKVADALEALRQDTTSKAIATRSERQSFWSSVMRSDEQMMKDRLKASELLGKSQVDFIDRKEVTGANGEPLPMPVRIEIVAVGTD